VRSTHVFTDQMIRLVLRHLPRDEWSLEALLNLASDEDEQPERGHEQANQ